MEPPLLTQPVPAPKRASCLQEFDGIWIRPRTFDRQIVRESRQYLRLAPTADDVLLDIGANIGAVSSRFLDAGLSKVVAVEPEPDNFAMLLRNLSRHTTRTVALQTAVAAEDGARQLWLNAGRNKGMHSLVQQPRRRSILVPTVTLRSLIETYDPTLIKLDIEGGEYELAKTLRALPARIRGIALELHLGMGSWRSIAAPTLIRGLGDQGFLADKAPRLGRGNPCTLGIRLR
jgi:FkbM family methyltransferase